MASVGDNILCHICVEIRQNKIPSGHTRGGYRQDLLENILTPLERSFVVCCSCEGVMRDPQFTEEGYKCSSCLDRRKGKPASVNKTEIEKLRVVCPFRQQGCVWSGTMGLVVTHVEKCDLCPVSCSLGCGHSSERKYSKRHEREDCPERNTKCEFCQTNIKVSQSCDHSKTCPSFPLKCSNGCNEDRIPRKDMSLHVSKFCPLSIVPCPYKKYGCVGVKRKDMDTHETDFMAKHVRIMNTRVDALNTQVNTLTDNQFNKGLEWEIKGVRDKFEMEEELFSDPFYINNYKFQGKAKFNTEDDNHLGIYLCLCVGLLDDSLKWPFLGKVTTTLVNIESSGNSITKSYLTKGFNVFNKPTEDGFGRGYCSFATEQDVLRKFSKDDSIRIKIEIKYLDKPDEFTKRITS